MTMRPEYNQVARIKVFGVGGAGCNAVNRMVDDGVKGVEFYVCNTDLQSLNQSKCANKIVLGKNTTKGLGAGGNPENGSKAAIESEEDIRKAIAGADMVFIACGEGGGTGTGAAPVVARIARDELKMLTIGIVTIPFKLEGNRKIRKALKGVYKLSRNVDALLIINNERISELYPEDDIQTGFARADSVLSDAATSIANLILIEGYINLDFADVKTTLRNGGVATINTGKGAGENRVKDAIEDAMKVPLLSNSNDISKAKRLLLNFYCSRAKSINMREHSAITEFVNTMDRDNVEVIYGFSYDDTLGEEVRLTLLATLDVSPVPQEIIDEENNKDQDPSNSVDDTKGKYDDWMNSLYDDLGINSKTGYPIVPLEELEDDKVLMNYKKPAYLRKKL